MATKLEQGVRALACMAAVFTACSGEIESPIGLQNSSNSHPEAAGGSTDEPTGVSMPALHCTGLHVGYTPLQRISRDQYVNALRDLLGVSIDRSALSDDERVGVFDGNNVASVTDLLVDEYASVAESAAKQAQPNLENLVRCDRGARGDAACAAQFIADFGLRVYRRPLSDDEQAAYVALYLEYEGGGYVSALRVIAQTMLQSPSFLYRVELQPVAPGQGEGTPLDAYELASRLSFFLLSTTPDAKLLEAAQSGALLDTDELVKQVERLLEDDRFADTLHSFHTHWLELQTLRSTSKDATLFPMFSANLAGQMLDETLRFVEHVIRKDDAKLETLLTASYGFPQGDLATLYAVTPAAAVDTPVQLDPRQRAGLLTQASFLAAHAHYDATSPVERGKIVIRNVLCQQLPDPPPNVNTTPPDPSGDATIRESLAVHQADASCAGCHERIDGIGLGFEQYDAIGAYRRTERGKPVDSSGEFLQGDVRGRFADSIELVHKLAASEDVKKCVATQWLRFALGRLESDADQCTLAKLFRDFASSEHDMRALLQAIVLSDAFRNKRVAEASP